MGMRLEASLDERGRITIPIEIRKIVGRKDFKIQLLDGDTIILRTIDTREDQIKKIEKIRLAGDPDRTHIDFSSVKDLIGG